jgi:uncharacterized membrane protein YsdA (DUF1294 family)
MYYLLAWNFFSFLIMGYDKAAARTSAQRVPEKYLFLTAVFMGALGVCMGMIVFRHKTLQGKFKVGMPALIMLNIIIAGLFNKVL